MSLLLVLLCLFIPVFSQEESIHINEVDKTVYYYSKIVACVVSIAALLPVIWLYATGPDISGIHGKCIVAFACQFICNHIAAATAYLTLVVRIYDFICTYSGIIENFTLVGSSFWIQVLAFDTWLTFLRIQDYGTCAPASAKRVRGYFIYAILAPTLLMLPSIFVTFRKRHLYYEDPDQSEEEDKCNEEYWTEKFLFIVWVVVLITGCFFLASASARMRRLENDLRIRFQTQRQRIVVYRNLFTVLVVPTVVLEVLVPIVTSLMGDESSPEWFKILCDSLFVISNLDGVWIFVASIWLTEYRSRICTEVEKDQEDWAYQPKRNVKINAVVCQTRISPTYSFKTTSV